MIANLFKTGYAIKHEKHFRDDFFQNALRTETVLNLASIETKKKIFWSMKQIYKSYDLI